MGELPEPWNAATEQAGIRQTYRGIGDAAGVSHVTVRRLIAEGRTSAVTIRKVAAALGVGESKVYEWADIPVSDWGPWDPPMQAHKLNPRARAALEELIRAITEGGISDDRKSEDQKIPLTTRDQVTKAARTVGTSPGKRMAQGARTQGEESQDDGIEPWDTGA